MWKKWVGGLLCVAIQLSLTDFCFAQPQWRVGSEVDAGWVMRKGEGESAFRRYFPVGSFGLPEYAPVENSERTDPDSADFYRETEYFNTLFLDKRSQRKHFMRNKPLISGWSDVHYLWYRLHGQIEGLGMFDRGDSRISYEEMQLIRNNRQAFAEKVVRPAFLNIQRQLLDPNSRYDLIWFLYDEPERGAKHWYWDPATVRVLHDEAKRIAPSSVTFVDLGPVEGSAYLYDQYIAREHGTSLPARLQDDTEFGDGVNYCTYHATLDGQNLFKWVPNDTLHPEAGGKAVYQKIKLPETLIEDHIRTVAAGYANSADVLGINSYGYFNLHPKNVAVAATAMREGAGAKPLWFFFQGFENGNPGAANLRCQVYTAIVHGVTGVLFYNNDNKATTYWNQVKALSDELRLNEHVITAPTISEQLEGDIRYVIKQVGDQPHVIAVNLGDTEQVIDIPGFASRTLASREAVILQGKTVSRLVINEAKLNSNSGKETRSSTEGWVEIYNPTANQIDLSRMHVTADTTSGRQWGFNSASLAPYSYTTVSFPVTDSTTYVALRDNGGRTIDIIPVSAGAVADGSVGRNPDQMFELIYFSATQATPGLRNTPAPAWRKKSSKTGFTLLNPFTTAMKLGRNVYVAGKDEMNQPAVWTSENGSAWTRVSQQLPFSAESRFFVHLQRLWAVDGTRIWMSEDGREWTEAQGSFPGSAKATLFSFNGNVWFVDGNRIGSTTNGTLWKTFEQRAPWAQDRTHPVITVHGNEVFLFGGASSAGEKIYRDGWVSGDGMTWRQIVQQVPWPSRVGAAATSFNGRIWVMGGRSADGERNDIWTSPNGLDWTKQHFSDLWAPRESSFCVEMNNTLWLGCGTSVAGELEDVWALGSRNYFELPADSSITLRYGDQLELPVADVTITVKDHNILTAGGNTIRATDIGSTTIEGIFNGDERWYPFSFSRSIQVTQRPLLISVDQLEAVYGDDIPKPQFRYDGFAPGEGPEQLDSLPRVTNLPQAKSAVGKYAIGLSPVSAKRYAVTCSAGHLVIKPRPLRVSVRSVEKFYGEADPEFEIIYDGFAPGEDVSVLSEVPTAVIPTNHDGTGRYELEPAGGRADNYEIVREKTFLTVNPRPLFVSARDTSRYFGQPNPEFLLKFEGFAPGEDETFLKEIPAGRTHADPYSPAGRYRIQIDGGAADNYRIVTQGGYLEVLPTSEVIAYPNPATTSVNFIIPYHAGEQDAVEIFSANGQQLLSQPLKGESNQYEIALADYAPGVYVYRIINNGRMFSGRLVKKNN